MLKGLAPDPTAFLVRGKLAAGVGQWGRHRATGELGYQTVRRTVARHGPNGAFEPQRRRMLMLDLDGIQLPAGMSIVTDPAACIRWAVENLLPAEFRDVDYVYQLSSSAGLTKADDQLNVHLWFFTDRPFEDEELRKWALWWNAKQRTKIVDPALFNSVQPHYVSDPELLEGLVDPFAGRRLGWVRGNRRAVPLYMPSQGEVLHEMRLRGERAKSAATAVFRRTKAAEPPRPSTDLDPDADPEPDTVDDETIAGGRGTAFGAVRDGPGCGGYLRMIGFEGHIRTQIRAAIGSYFFEHGSRAPHQKLRETIEEAINKSPFLECGEPWSRRRGEALAYLQSSADCISNVEEMIRDIARYQAAQERVAEACEPTWSLPSFTADAAGVRQAAASSKDAAAARRMLALALVLEGASRARAATSCGMDRQTLRDWVHRYNAEGLPGLSNKRLPGAAAKLTAAQTAKVAEWVRAGPKLAEDGVIRWRRIDLAAKIDREFGVSLAERSVGDLLHRLGFRRVSVRPQHPKQDGAALEAH